MRLPRTCVIGACCSGIAAAKALQERGVPVVVFEASDRVGGNWVLPVAPAVGAEAAA